MAGIPMPGPGTDKAFDREDAEADREQADTPDDDDDDEELNPDDDAGDGAVGGK